MTIKELEELIKTASNKDLPVHCWVGDNVETEKFELKEARLEDKALVLIEGDEIEEEEKEEEDE